MATYRVKPGFRHGKSKEYGPGDNIELSVEEASGFLDKLELVDSTSSSTGDDGQQPPNGDDGNQQPPNGGDNLNTIEPWRGLEAKIVIALEAGGVTPAMVTTLTDDELLSVAGIGAASLAKIRSAFSG